MAPLKLSFIEFMGDHLADLIPEIKAANISVELVDTLPALAIIPATRSHANKLVKSAPRLMDLLQRYEIDLAIAIFEPPRQDKTIKVPVRVL